MKCVRYGASLTTYEAYEEVSTLKAHVMAKGGNVSVASIYRIASRVT